MSASDALTATTTTPAGGRRWAEPDDGAVGSISFRFVIDRAGKILSFEGSPALERFGWSRVLGGRPCYVELACRDLEGRPLCDLCVRMRAAPPNAGERPRAAARLAGSGGDVVVTRSSVRRLPQRHLSIEGVV